MIEFKRGRLVVTIDDVGFVHFEPVEWRDNIEMLVAEGFAVRASPTGPNENASLLPTAPRWVLFETVKDGLHWAKAGNLRITITEDDALEYPDTDLPDGAIA